MLSSSSQTLFWGKTWAKCFWSESFFEYVLKFFGRLLELDSTNPGEQCKETFVFAKHLIYNAFFSSENLWRTFGFYNLWKSAWFDRKIPARMSKSLVTFSELHHLGKQIPDKLEHFWFFLSANKKKAGLSNCLLRIQRSFFRRKKSETTKKTVSILNDKLSNFEQLLFVRVAKTARYESIGTFCSKKLQETMSHYFSFLQFSSNKFSVWCRNCILRVQRKSLTSFFSEFS